MRLLSFATLLRVSEAVFLGNSGDRQIVDSNELRDLAGVLGRTASERDGILGQVGQLLAGVDGRGWDVGAVNSLWWRVRGRGQQGSSELQSLARDLMGRAGLLDEMEGMSLPGGVGWPIPVDGPLIGGGGLPGITDGPGGWDLPGNDGLPGITDRPGSWGLPGETSPGNGRPPIDLPSDGGGLPGIQFDKPADDDTGDDERQPTPNPDDPESQDQPPPDAGGQDNQGPYAPKRELPRDPTTGNPLPEPDAQGPHTQLGTRTSRSGRGPATYPQGREFDENGKPVRDIDWTDHGRPHLPGHVIPHQHVYDPATGKRGPAQPLSPDAPGA